MRRRKRGKSWKIPAVLLAVVLLCALLMRFVFVVRSVDVQGNTSSLSRESVVRRARVGFGTSIFRVDKQDIEYRINSTGLLIARDVRIKYPNTVSIVVEPRVRAAMTLHLGQMRILDADGYVVESLLEVPDMDLIYVSGMKIQNASAGEPLRTDAGQLEAYCAAVQAIRSQGAGAYVSELVLGDPDNIRIITRTGITVELGDASRMSDKIAWMKSAVADLESRGTKGGTLDVRGANKADYRLPPTPAPTYSP